MTKTLKNLLKPFKVSFWGSDSIVTPLLCDTIFGDGRLVIAFVPLNTRPERYIVCIDSKTDLDSDKWYDEIDDVWTALEEQFGEASYQDEAGEWHHVEWPAVDSASGCLWSELARLRKTPCLDIASSP